MALAVFYALLQLLVLAGIGFGLARFTGWPREVFRGFNRFVASVALPLYFFTSIAKTDPAVLRESWIFPVSALCINLLGLACSALVFRILPVTSGERRAGVALGTFGNSGYLPLALMEILPVTLPALSAQFGFDSAALPVGAYLLVHSPMLWTLGNWLVSGSERPRVAELLPPPFLGIVAGLLAAAFGARGILLDPGLPLYHLIRPLERIGATAVPLIMVALGATIAELGAGGHPRARLFEMAGAVSLVRFALVPACFVAAWFLLLKPSGFTPAQTWVVFMMTHLPPATNLSVMAARAGRNEQAVSFTLLFTYLVYMVLLPLYILLFLALVG